MQTDSHTHFDMSVNWANMQIFKSQLCMGKSMAVQVIHLVRY